MNSRSRSTLFLMEQLIVILVFAICAAVCVRIFVDSFVVSRNSKDMKNSLIAAENAAECFKAFGGDTDMLTEHFEGISDSSGSKVTVYYDSKWNSCDESGAEYTMCIFVYPDGTAPILSGDISVKKISGEEIVAFTVTARSHAYE